jgi:hypothetical protein
MSLSVFSHPPFLGFHRSLISSEDDAASSTLVDLSGYKGIYDPVSPAVAPLPGDAEEGDAEEGDAEEGDAEEGSAEEGSAEEGSAEEGSSSSTPPPSPEMAMNRRRDISMLRLIDSVKHLLYDGHEVPVGDKDDGVDGFYAIDRFLSISKIRGRIFVCVKWEQGDTTLEGVHNLYHCKRSFKQLKHWIRSGRPKRQKRGCHLDKSIGGRAATTITITTALTSAKVFYDFTRSQPGSLSCLDDAYVHATRIFGGSVETHAKITSLEELREVMQSQGSRIRVARRIKIADQFVKYQHFPVGSVVIGVAVTITDSAHAFVVDGRRRVPVLLDSSNQSAVKYNPASVAWIKNWTKAYIVQERL